MGKLSCISPKQPAGNMMIMFADVCKYRCMVDSECRSFQRCSVDGVCVARDGDACTANEDCAEPFHCSNGKCKSNQKRNAVCISINDCGK